jgi:c-di-GMP-binding flagellar brake protein YcgR
MDERRSMPRWQINHPAELTVENGIRSISCLIEDISLTGMRIVLKRNLFDEVFANFRLAFGLDFELDMGARVIWRDQTSETNIYGLAFNRSDDSIRTKIDGYVKKNFPDLLAKQWWKGG